MLANPHPNDAAGAAAASSLDEEAAERPARGRLSRLLIRPEAGGVVSAILVFAFFAIAAGQNGFLSPPSAPPTGSTPPPTSASSRSRSVC